MKYLHLVRILMKDEEGKEFNIYFSGLVVKSALTRSGATRVEASTGPDVKAYDKYFEVPEEDRKYL